MTGGFDHSGTFDVFDHWNIFSEGFYGFSLSAHVSGSAPEMDLFVSKLLRLP